MKFSDKSKFLKSGNFKLVNPTDNIVIIPPKTTAGTVPINLAGLPAISIPNGNVDNKPTGIQIIGNFLDESSILNFAHMFQTSTDWHMHTPEGVKK